MKFKPGDKVRFKNYFLNDVERNAGLIVGCCYLVNEYTNVLGSFTHLSKLDGTYITCVNPEQLESAESPTMSVENDRNKVDFLVNLNVKITKLDKNAVIPSYAKSGDAGMDLTCINYEYNRFNGFYEYFTGLAVEVPPGYVGLIFPRSSLSKKDLLLTNHVGVLDSCYRGEIKARFKATVPPEDMPEIYKIGDKIAQLVIMPYPKVNFVEVAELSNTERGTGGFGSTD